VRGDGGEVRGDEGEEVENEERIRERRRGDWWDGVKWDEEGEEYYIIS
jgi:hypothetical protein